MLMNEDVVPGTETVVIPKEALQTVIAPHSVADQGENNPEVSCETYGLGWSQDSYQGHDVSLYTSARSLITILHTESSPWRQKRRLLDLYRLLT